MPRGDSRGDELRSGVSHFRQQFFSAFVDQRDIGQIEDAANSISTLVVVFPAGAQHRHRWARQSAAQRPSAFRRGLCLGYPQQVGLRYAESKGTRRTMRTQTLLCFAIT